jgi:tetratricopeptide (TPR) repeat protein
MRGLVALLELPVSRRGLPVVFLLLAGGLAVAGWLRPPLTTDISGLHIPIGLGTTPGPSPEVILYGPRRVTADSLGLVLVALIAGAILVVLWRPQRFGMVAGVLMAASIAANAAAALNHPGLIERIDSEYEQWQQIVTVDLQSKTQVLANYPTGRINLVGQPAENDHRGDPVRGFVYLLYGRWLVLLAGAGVLLAGCSALRRRLACLAGWALLGVLLACAVCFPRLRAEYYWTQAQLLEARCDYAGSRRALQQAVDRYPELGALQRTWLLAGKLDYRLGSVTPRERYFRAYQIARDKEEFRGLATLEDLPWTITAAPDYRQGLAPLPAGLDLSELPGAVGAPDFLEGTPFPRGPLLTAYHFTLHRGRRQALALMDDLLGEGHTDPAVREQAARLWTDLGLAYYMDVPVFVDSALDYNPQDRHLGAAEDVWRKAAELGTYRRDCAMYLGTISARVYNTRPDRAEADFGPILNRLGDRVLRADIQATLGDAYFEAGRTLEARRRYAESLDAFCLPTIINFRAQKALGGL